MVEAGPLPEEKIFPGSVTGFRCSGAQMWFRGWSVRDIMHIKDCRLTVLPEIRNGIFDEAA